MMLFWVICALLLVVALAFILPPLYHPDRSIAGISNSESNIAVYRDQLAEIESDRRDGMITAEQFLRDREELEQRVNADVPNDSPHDRKSKTVRIGNLYYWLAVGVPLAVTLVYLILGSPPSSKM
jgi:cytochrome c-type biogenesis protein CcmH